jgi:hypothetical protein
MNGSHPLGNTIEFHPSFQESQRLGFNLARTYFDLNFCISEMPSTSRSKLKPALPFTNNLI